MLCGCSDICASTQCMSAHPLLVRGDEIVFSLSTIFPLYILTASYRYIQLYILTSIEGGAHTHYRSISACEPRPQSMFNSTLL